ncbi:MAG: hypothetical protein M1827_006524 [Pycnora praestabilis]|nr:MAG: hypothetical protein M1827_006524 [Pycnora praestabilis]
MAGSVPASKTSSRWGSFLQQAVAGVESRLDTILADEGDSSVRESAPDAKVSPIPLGTVLPPAEGSLTRKVPGSAVQDRLQERLAKATAQKNNAGRSESPASSASSSGPASPVIAVSSPRSSLETKGKEAGIESQRTSRVVFGPASKPEGSTAESPAPDVTGGRQELAQLPASSNPYPETSSNESSESHHPVESQLTGSSHAKPASNEVFVAVDVLNSSGKSRQSAETYEAMMAQMQSDYEISELRRQEETHAYIERIDALQSKLLYLTKESAEAARKAAVSSSAGSPAKKLAEKDEQIALLIGEGQTLSKTELKHTTTIKKLRAKASEYEKALAEAKRKLEKAEKDARDAKEKAKRAEGAERRICERLRTTSNLEKEIDDLRTELLSNGSVLANVKSELAQATINLETAGKQAQKNALETEQKIIIELRNELSNLRIDKDLSVERMKAEVRRLKEQHHAALERSKYVEAELREEQSVLESKMEVLRARAEEVSTGVTGDAQAKLLRQIDTLQIQYAVASENWQGIEGSLLSRLTTLEKEKDETAKREADIRRKAREMVGPNIHGVTVLRVANEKKDLRSRRAEEDLEASTATVEGLRHEYTEQKQQLNKLRRRLSQAEVILIEAKAEHARERQLWETESAQRLETERQKWREEAIQTASMYRQHRAESPIASARKGSATDLLALQTRRHLHRVVSADISVSASDRPSNVRASGQSLRIQNAGIPQKYDSLALELVDDHIPETPSIYAAEHDDFFEGVATPSSPHRTINDVVSVSTVGVGPSVQLVERMSAAVRRLESEKMSLKEELLRLAAQRDEARKEVVSLMSEVERKHAADDRIQKLEAEMLQVNERYQTTLEMLGEKSEMVEELQADVADVKKIYRELVDSTMR